MLRNVQDDGKRNANLSIIRLFYWRAINVIWITIMPDLLSLSVHQFKDLTNKRASQKCLLSRLSVANVYSLLLQIAMRWSTHTQNSFFQYSYSRLAKFLPTLNMVARNPGYMFIFRTDIYYGYLCNELELRPKSNSHIKYYSMCDL